MINLWKYYLKPIFTFTNFHSPKGRKLRIDRLVERTKLERDICAAIVYARDEFHSAYFTDEEVEDVERIIKRIENNEISFPANRSFLANTFINLRGDSNETWCFSKGSRIYFPQKIFR